MSVDKVVKKDVRKLLEVCRELTGVVQGLEDAGFVPDSLYGILGSLADIIRSMYGITSDPNQGEDEFFDIVFRYGDGDFEIDECLKRLDEFAEKEGKNGVGRSNDTTRDNGAAV